MHTAFENNKKRDYKICVENETLNILLFNNLTTSPSFYERVVNEAQPS